MNFCLKLKVKKNKTDLLSAAKYTSEVHRVETEDGYLLKVHRILPRGLSLKKGPVLLIHGLFGTAADFLLTGPDDALGESSFFFKKKKQAKSASSRLFAG